MQDNNKLLTQLAGLVQRLKDDDYNVADVMQQILSALNTGEQDLDAREIADTKHLRLFCSVYNNAAQVIPTGVLTALTYNTRIFNYGNMFDPANPTYITIPYDGRYTLKAMARFAINAVGSRQLVFHNITKAIFPDSLWVPTNGAVPTDLSISLTDFFYAGDRISVEVLQDSGGNLNINNVGTISPSLKVHGLCNLS